MTVVRAPECGLASILPSGTLAELLDEQVVLWAGWVPDNRLATLPGSRLGTLASRYGRQPCGDLTSLAGLVETVLAAMASSPAEFLEFNRVVMTSDGIQVPDAIGAQMLENGEFT